MGDDVVSLLGVSTAISTVNATVNTLGGQFSITNGSGAINLANISTNSGTVNVTTNAGISVGTLTAQTLGLKASGAITETGTIIVPGTTTLEAGATNNIILPLANNFGTVIVNSANNVQLNDSNTIDLGNMSVSGNLQVTTATGNITDSGTLSISGTSSFTAGGGGDIILDSASNSFTGALSASGNNITISDTVPASLTLGTITAAGALNVTAQTINTSANVTASSITMTASAAGGITVGGGTTLNTSGAPNGPVTLLADALTLTGNINAGTGTVTVAPYTTTNTVGIFQGGGPLGVYNTNYNIGTLTPQITAGLLVFGRTLQTGDITLEAITPSMDVSVINGGTGKIIVSGYYNSSGTPGADLSLTPGTVVRLDNDISTQGGAVTINGDTLISGSRIIDTINGAVTPGAVTMGRIDALTNNSDNLTINALSGGVGAAVSLGDYGQGVVPGGSGATAGSLNAYGGATTLGNVHADNGHIDIFGPTSITLTGSSYLTTTAGYISFSGPALLSNNSVSVTTAGGAGDNVHFTSTIDSLTTARALSISTGSDTVLIGGAIGASTALSSLTINNAAESGGITLSNNIGTAGAAGVTGATIIGNNNTTSVELDGAVYRTTGSQFYDATGLVANTIILHSNVTTQFITAGSNVTFDLALPANIYLLGTTNLDVRTNGGDINARGGIRAAGTDRTVYLDAGTGSFDLGTIGNGNEILHVDILGSGANSKLEGNIITSNTGGATNYVNITGGAGTITLASPTNSNIIDTSASAGNNGINLISGTFTGVDFNHGLQLLAGNGAVNISGATLTSLDHLIITSATANLGSMTLGDGAQNPSVVGDALNVTTTVGAITLTNATISTTGDPSTNAGNVVLTPATKVVLAGGGVSTINTDAAGTDANITLGVVDATNAVTRESLTLTAGAGTITLNGAIGGVTYLDKFTATGATVDVNANITAGNIALTGSAVVDLSTNPITLTVMGDTGTPGYGDILLKSNSITFNVGTTLVGTAGTQTVTFEGNTGGTTIGVGSAAVGVLNISEATLNSVQSSIETIIIGVAGAGNQTGAIQINDAGGLLVSNTALTINADIGGLTIGSNLTLANAVSGFTVNGASKSRRFWNNNQRRSG